MPPAYVPIPTASGTVVIDDKTFSGATTYTSPTWIAGLYRRLKLTITVTTPPGSGSLNITLTGRGGTYTMNGAFGLGAAPGGTTTATWAIFGAGTDTVFGVFTMDIVDGRPLGLLGQVSDTTAGYFVTVSGFNTTTAGSATNLVITGPSNWTGSVYLEGTF